MCILIIILTDERKVHQQIALVPVRPPQPLHHTQVALHHRHQYLYTRRKRRRGIKIRRRRRRGRENIVRLHHDTTQILNQTAPRKRGKRRKRKRRKGKRRGARNTKNTKSRVHIGERGRREAQAQAQAQVQWGQNQKRQRRKMLTGISDFIINLSI